MRKRWKHDTDMAKRPVCFTVNRTYGSSGSETVVREKQSVSVQNVELVIKYEPN